MPKDNRPKLDRKWLADAVITTRPSALRHDAKRDPLAFAIKGTTLEAMPVLDELAILKILAGDSPSAPDEIVYSDTMTPVFVYGYKVQDVPVTQVLNDFENTLEDVKESVALITPEFIERWIARIRAANGDPLKLRSRE